MAAMPETFRPPLLKQAMLMAHPTPYRIAPMALLMAAMAACTTAPPRQPPPAVVPPPAETAKPAPPPEARPALAPPAETNPQPPRSRAPQAPVSSPAVLALIEEAEDSSGAGQLDNAAASLERAIRIQPRNALLWQKLAEVRLRQFQPGLAEDLAKKSNLLAKGDAALIRKNWVIIAEARRKKGDAEGAADADAKAGR